MQLLMLFMNLGNAHNHCVRHRESVLFHLVLAELDSSNPCVNSYATTINVSTVNGSQEYKLLKELNSPRSHPPKIPMLPSSIGSKYLKNGDFPSQDMHACPIYVVGSTEGILKKKKTKGDDQARLEKFLKDYEALKPTRFSYADIKRITNHFKDEIGGGAHGSVFKGQLSNQMVVAVKVLNNSVSDDDGKDFINEVGTMDKSHHINVICLLGFCAEGFHRALVCGFFSNGSLQKFISSPDNKENFLEWLKLNQIALGIAKGMISTMTFDSKNYFNAGSSNVLERHLNLELEIIHELE
ncbi:hypothetical protein K1719_016422 [Acacia pycnantha]|nr:hypothetical protein K1719_016422 [Acacia pycnantha]